MMHSVPSIRFLASVAALGAAWFGVDPRPIRAADARPANPYTYLFDTGAEAADPLPTAAVRAKNGWKALAEDDLTHRFTGDAALANDRLVIVLRGKASGAELYARTATGPARQATILPVASAAGAPALSILRIVENNPGAVMVETGVQSKGGRMAKLTWRLTTGQTFVELHPSEGVEKVRIEAPSAYVAVPDFFGDDMLFTAGSSAGRRLGLPAENFFLQFIGHGQGLIMCVWPSARQQAAAIISGQGSQRTIAGTEIQCAAGKSLWIAALAAPGIWHEQVLPPAQSTHEMVLDWKPPFPAKWRISAAGGGIGPSWYFHGTDESEAAGPLGEPSPCCFEGQRAVVRLSALPGPPMGPRSLVVYAIDRTRTTPLTAFCPIDILRATLGVGPCQYILQTEGLASDTNPTPANVMTWVEKQFARKKEKKVSGEIRENLAQMVAHVAHADRRIAEYGQLARDTRAVCTGPAADSLRATLDYFDRTLSAVSGPAHPAEQARKLADELLALIGKADAAAQCRTIAVEVRRLGAAQDRTLANCRMAARWLGQQTSMMETQNPQSAELARQIQMRIEKVLQRK